MSASSDWGVALGRGLAGVFSSEERDVLDIQDGG